MLVMVTLTWPSESSVKVGKVTVKALAKDMPPYVKRHGFYVAAGINGMKAYALYGLEDGHVDEGFVELMKRYAPYIGIKGWEFMVEPLLTTEDALSLVQLEL